MEQGLSIEQLKNLKLKLDMLGIYNIIRNDIITYEIDGKFVDLLNSFLLVVDENNNYTLYIPYESNVIDLAYNDNGVTMSYGLFYDKPIKREEHKVLGSMSLINVFTHIRNEVGTKNISELKVIGGEGLVTCKSMFYCIKANKIDLTEFRPINALDFSEAFQNCNVNIIKCTGLRMDNAIDVTKLFDGASIGTLYCRDMYMPKIRNLRALLSNTTITLIDKLNFDLTKINDIQYMFYNATFLCNLDLSELDTSHVCLMERLFYKMNCDQLNLSNFSIDSLKYSKHSKHSREAMFFESIVSNNSILESTDKKFNTYMKKYARYEKTINDKIRITIRYK